MMYISCWAISPVSDLILLIEEDFCNNAAPNIFPSLPFFREGWSADFKVAMLLCWPLQPCSAPCLYHR